MVVRVNLHEKVRFEQSLEESEGVYQVISEERVLQAVGIARAKGASCVCVCVGTRARHAPTKGSRLPGNPGVQHGASEAGTSVRSVGGALREAVPAVHRAPGKAPLRTRALTKWTGEPWGFEQRCWDATLCMCGSKCSTEKISKEGRGPPASAETQVKDRRMLAQAQDRT